MQREYGWGWDYTYMMSALEDIHPVYCQTLRSTDQYSKEQVANILASIAPESRRKFDRTSLTRAIDKTVNASPVEDSDDVELDCFEAEPADEVLVIGGGPSTTRYRSALAQFISEKQPLVIECNPLDGELAERADQYLQAVLNWVRLERLLRAGGTSKPLVTGVSALPRLFGCQRRLIRQMPYRIAHEEFSVQREQLVLPDYDVGMFALGVAALSSPKRIYIAGFDGYDSEGGDDPSRVDLGGFWPMLSARSNSELISLTPSEWDVPTRSIFGYLK